MSHKDKLVVSRFSFLYNFRRLSAFEPRLDINKPCERMFAWKHVQYFSSRIEGVFYSQILIFLQETSFSKHED